MKKQDRMAVIDVFLARSLRKRMSGSLIRLHCFTAKKTVIADFYGIPILYLFAFVWKIIIPSQ